MTKVRGWANWTLGLAVVGLIGGCSLITDDLAQVFQVKNPHVEARKKIMRGMSGNVKKLKAALKAGGNGIFGKVKSHASDIANLARQIPGAFENQTLAGKTTATPKIWQTKSEFDQIAANLALSAQLLTSSAESEDLSGVKNGVNTLAANCGKCHKAYRVKKKK